MITLANTIENNYKVEALKKLTNMSWNGNTIHESIDKCFTAINLESNNSGWYKPTVTRIKGLAGYFMINEDGSLFFEARVIKEDDKKYRIEYLTSAGYDVFENLYFQLLEN